MTKQDIPIWENQWGGKNIYVEGTAHSQGEMILISKQINCEVNIIKQRSRLLVIHIKGEGIDVVIANVYAPNLKAEKKICFDLIFENLNDFEGSQVIIMGDFNSVINSDLDIVSGNPHCTQDVLRFSQTMSRLNVINVWRVLHADEKAYTWSKAQPFIARRLDYCFVSDNVMQSYVSCDIVSLPNTDHRAVTLRLSTSSFVRGPGYWRFNNSYLKDPVYVDKLNNMLENTLIEEMQISNTQKCMGFNKSENQRFLYRLRGNKASKFRNRELSLQIKLEELEKTCIS